ncbi:SNF2 domain-containing protein CLASSY 4-like [Juglans microcarpa x Juglans regia]|uniref:SNF2 domain-containing protein CLASSY 4-like n=1 Tax=Juglans microcarpa x Juglans regia TaxID=2249226 RepID=UPI001B7EDC33|nr:SNF2 domain-containing protein CLASSY 4-like [Juglans microcarpa x Juglans regia]
MIDYSLPIAKRTRQKQALIYKEYSEQKRKNEREENNGVTSYSSRRPSRGNRKKLLEDNTKGVCGSLRLGTNCRAETQTETVSVSDRSEEASVEEIHVNDSVERCRTESRDFVGRKSMGLKNEENSKTGFEGMNNVKEIMVDDSDEQMVVLREGVGLDWLNSNCSSLKLGVEGDEGVVCIEVDDGNGLRGKHVNECGSPHSSGKRDNDEMISSLKRKVESGCLIFSDRKSSGVTGRTQSRLGFLKRNEIEDGDDDRTWSRSGLLKRNEDGHGGVDAASDNSDGSKRNTDEDGDGNIVSDGLRRNVDEDGGDNVVSVDSDGFEISLKLESCDNFAALSSDSWAEEEEKEEDYEENENRGNHERVRPRGIDNGFKKRKYGLDMLLNSQNDKDSNINNDKGCCSVNPSKEFDCVAGRTRSHFTPKWGKKKMELGTLSRPFCLDEEEMESFSGHDDSDDSGDKREVGSDYENEDDLSDDESEDDLSDDETYLGVKKAVSTREKCKTNKGKLRMPTEGKCIRLVKSCDFMKILVDSMLEKGEFSLEELDCSRDVASRNESNPPVAETTLPLKFTFGIEESNPPEKSEDEKEMDELWAQLELALRASEIGSVDSAKVEDEDALPPEDDIDRATLCHLGNHRLILDEQVGLRCAFCSYVKMEIKYILPSFSTNSCGKLDRRDSGGAMNHSIFNEFGSQYSGCDSYSDCDTRAHAEGTVWDIVPGIKSSMYPHQRDGFEFIWKNIAGGIYVDKLENQTAFHGGNGCIISHAPGTGKTRLTIGFLQTYMEFYPSCRPIIVAPCSMLLTWEEEFHKWKFDIPFHNLNKSELSGKESRLTDYIVRQVGHLDQRDIRILKLYSWKMDRSILGISYKLFAQLTGEVERKGEVRLNTEHAQLRKVLLELPGLVVLDEGHIPRNSDSNILQALSNIKTEKRIILSGTPFQNNFDELYNTLCLARPQFANIRHKWGSLTSSIAKATDDRTRCEKLKKVRDMIEPFVHVHKGSILQEKLPGLRDSVVILQPAQLQKSLFDELCHHALTNHFKFEYYESLISVHPSLLLKCGEEKFPSDRVKLERLNPDAGVKTKFLMELIRLSEAMNEKVLVFSQYLDPLIFVMDQLKSHFNWTEGNEVLYMDGQLDVKQRQSSINVFNDPTSEVRVLLASIRACSEGINLVGASRVVLLDVVWNPSVERQAICRAHRLGQEKVVYVYHLIVFGTKEEEKYYRQVEKDWLSELVFSPSDRSGDQEKLPPTDLQDEILEEMVKHEKLEHIFEKIAYQQKESKLIETFTLLEKRPVI